MGIQFKVTKDLNLFNYESQLKKSVHTVSFLQLLQILSILDILMIHFMIEFIT